MQPQNFLTSIPQELVFPCVTGYFNPSNRIAVRNLICSGIRVKSTCKDMHEKIEKCWKISLEALWEDWKSCASLRNFSKETFIKQMKPSLVLNWIDGKPEIGKQSLHDFLKNGFALDMTPKDEARLLEISDGCDHAVPYFWSSHLSQDIVAFTRYTLFGDAIFFNVKTGKFIGEICGGVGKTLLFNRHIKPLFYKDTIIVLFQRVLGSAGLDFYAIEDGKLSLKKSVSLSLESLFSMDLFNDLLVFQVEDRHPSRNIIRVISLEDLDSSPTAVFISPSLIWPSFFIMEAFKEKVVMFRDGKKGLVCESMQIEDRNLKFNRHPVEGKGLVNQLFSEFRPIFYYAGNYAFFLTCNIGREHTVSAISTEELNSSDPALTPLNSLPQEGFARLVQFKDSVILCSGKMGAPLKFQTVEVMNGEIKITPLLVHGVEDYKFNRLDCIHAHLDKLFLIGVLAKDSSRWIPEPYNYLVTINMESQAIENKYRLALDMYPRIMTTAPGCLYISNPQKHNIFKIKY